MDLLCLKFCRETLSPYQDGPTDVQQVHKYNILTENKENIFLLNFEPLNCQ